MSGIVTFSDGSSWSVGRRGWNLLLERTRQVLTGEGLGHLCGEITDYGAFFNRDPDEVRVPLAKALLDVVIELQPELASQDQWDVESRGPYFGELENRLRRELGLNADAP